MGGGHRYPPNFTFMKSKFIVSLLLGAAITSGSLSAFAASANDFIYKHVDTDGTTLLDVPYTPISSDNSIAIWRDGLQWFESFSAGTGIDFDSSSHTIRVFAIPQSSVTGLSSVLSGLTSSIAGLESNNSGILFPVRITVDDIKSNVFATSTTMRVGYGTSTVAGLVETTKWNALNAAVASATSTLASLSATVAGLTTGVTSITAGTGLSGGTITSTGTISLPNVGTAGTYGAVTTDAQGRVTAGKRMETYSGTTNGSGNYTVTFGTAYSVAPNIQANIVGSTDTQTSRITNISTTGFTVLVRNRTDVVGLLPSYSNVSGASVDVLITEK